MKEERNPVLWNVETTELNELAYQLYLNEVEKLNLQLFLRQEDKRASYATLDDFLCHMKIKKEYTDKALIIIRKHKIEKIWKRN